MSKDEIFESAVDRRISADTPYHFPAHNWSPKPKTRAEKLRESTNSQVTTVVGSFLKSFDLESQKAASTGQRRVTMRFSCVNDDIKEAIVGALKREGLAVTYSYTDTLNRVVTFVVTW